MSVLLSNRGRVLLRQWDITCALKGYTAEHSADLADTTSLCESSKRYDAVGHLDAKVSLSGMYEADATTPGTTDKVADILNDAFTQTSSYPLTIAQEGLGTIGNRAVVVAGLAASYKPQASVGDVVMLSAELQCARGGAPGRLLHANGAENASTTSLGVNDSTAATTGGAVLVLHVLANTRDAAVTVKVQHSADSTDGTDGTWADLATFAVVAAGTLTSEALTVAKGTTVNGWLRAVSTVAAGTGAITYVAAAARTESA